MENERRYFGINCPDGHSSSDNIIKDIVACPNCGALLKYDYIRYNHIGRAHCPNCDFGSPELDYSVEKIDYENQRCLIKMPGGTCEFKLIGSNVTDIYNMLAAIALLSELGLEVSQIQKSFEKIKVVESRYYSENVHGKELVISLAKGQNPIACSRICDFIRHETGTKAVVCMMDDCYDAKESSENIAWIFDIDFEFLNDASVKQIVLTGVRNADYHLRLLMAGIPEEKIVLCDKEEDAASYVDYAAVDKIYILHDIYSVQYENAKKVYQDLKNRLEERGEEA